MKKLIIIAAALTCSLTLKAQVQTADAFEVPECENYYIRNEIRIPDVGKYKVLKSDLHIHTIFSDGDIWPALRVHEAWQEGLDVIAITEHIECRPFKDVLKGDHNEAYRIAKRAARSRNILVIHGTEITRGKPLGHINALFIQDANRMDVADSLEAVEEAYRQGAFIQWNHPGWPDDKSTFYPIHKKLIKEGKIHGLELVNEIEFYPKAFDWFEPNNLAPTANSDIHETITSKYTGRRPMTLILSEANTEEAVKEALFARRTIAYYADVLVATPAMLKSLIKACLEIVIAPDGTVIFKNNSDLLFKIKYNGQMMILDGAKSFRYDEIKDMKSIFEFDNCFVGNNKRFTMTAAELLQ